MLAKLTYLFLFFSLLPAQSAYNLYSPEIELPQIGSNESIHYGFWLHADIPDSDGDGDDGLEDYYFEVCTVTERTDDNIDITYRGGF